MKLTPIIGLEIHVELKTKSKMFCSCANDPFVSMPNNNVCEICLAHPGTLPVPNKTAIEWTVKIAKALGCQIATESKFDRKHYFYPDLPKGYQISQYDEPIGANGSLELDFAPGVNYREQATIRITRVHLEEDTAKLTHTAKEQTLVDFNRAGVPLVEIVSHPDIESAVEAKTYCQELQLILRYLGVSGADMEKGQMRCEANISVQETGSFEKDGHLIKPKAGKTLNNKVEVKNINSFRAVEKAINFEIKRQTELLEKGQTWGQETRGWDADKQETVAQRVKETAADYRYFPEPDIPPFSPLKIAGDVTIPELPRARRNRFHAEYGFSLADAEILSGNLEWSAYAEAVMSELNDWVKNMPESKACVSRDKNTDHREVCRPTSEIVRLAGGWLTTRLMGAMADRKIDIKILKVRPENFAELIALIFTNKVNSTNAQKILEEMLDSGVDMDPTHIMEEKGYGQVSDEGKIGAIVDEVIKSHPVEIEKFKSGKVALLKFLIGMVMKATEGSADPVLTEKMLKEKLK